MYITFSIESEKFPGLGNIVDNVIYNNIKKRNGRKELYHTTGFM